LKKSLVAAALGLLSAVVALAIGRLDFARTVELKTYDVRMRLTADPSQARTEIALVAIDDESIRRLAPVVGRWPWPRLVHAQLLNFLARGPARVIAYDVFFTEEDLRSFDIEGEKWSGAESDAALAEATAQAGRVIHMADVTAQAREGERDEAVARQPGTAHAGFRVENAAEARPVVRWPYPALAHASHAVAHNLFVLDEDGPLRRFVPFVSVDGVYLPSLGTAAALAALNIQPSEVRQSGDTLRLRDRHLPLIVGEIRSFYGDRRPSHRSLIRYRGGVMANGKPTYREFSFYSLFYSEQQLLAGMKPVVDPASFRDRLVFVGTTAPGLHDVFPNPFGDKMPGAQIHAAVADDILSARTLRQAPWAATAAITLACGILLAAVAVYLGPWLSTAIALVGAAALAGILTVVFGRGLWLGTVEPLAAIALAAFGGVTYQYVVEGREKRLVKQLFSRYVSPDVYSRLLQDPSVARLGGERRTMTVLFSDIRGFTTVSERGQPEEILSQLNEYFSRMVPIVFAHKGTIDKFVGDMIMALFGAPVHDDRHADHAVQAATAMVRELDALNAEWRSHGRPALDIGIGINTGDMVAGNVGSDTIMSYTVIGDQVNLGARLESLNKEYGTRILISETTRSLLSHDQPVRPLGSVTVKGKTKAVDIYEVVTTEVRNP
jgi:adenylate cyclase